MIAAFNVYSLNIYMMPLMFGRAWDRPSHRSMICAGCRAVARVLLKPDTNLILNEQKKKIVKEIT